MNRETFFKERTLELCFQCAGFDDSGAKISNRNDKKVKQILNLVWDLGETKTLVYE